MRQDRKTRGPVVGSVAGKREVCIDGDKPLRVVKLFLDHQRIPPAGWVHVRTAAAAIEILQTGTVIEVSLDHDLGDDDVHGTGYDVIVWIEEAVAMQQFIPPKEIRVHSVNVSARQKMEAGIESIYHLYEENLIG